MADLPTSSSALNVNGARHGLTAVITVVTLLILQGLTDIPRQVVFASLSYAISGDGSRDGPLFRLLIAALSDIVPVAIFYCLVLMIVSSVGAFLSSSVANGMTRARSPD